MTFPVAYSSHIPFERSLMSTSSCKRVSEIDIVGQTLFYYCGMREARFWTINSWVHVIDLAWHRGGSAGSVP